MAPTNNLLFERGKALCSSNAYCTLSSGFLNDGSSRTPVLVKSTTEPCAVYMRREKVFLDHLRGCPQIIHCYGAATSTYKTAMLPGSPPTYNLLLESASRRCSLYDYLQHGPMKEHVARQYTRSLLRALVHVHRNNVVHCDVQPQNVMLWGADEVKLVNFCLAMRAGETNDLFFRGTPSYLAPECLVRNEHGAPADVWALGCTVAEMLTGKMARRYPDGMPFKTFLSLVLNGQLRPGIPEGMSEMGKDFLSWCFELDPRKRWTAEKLLKHPYVGYVNDWEGEYSNTSAWKEKVFDICVGGHTVEQLFYEAT